jgi:hypothetical protein
MTFAGRGRAMRQHLRAPALLRLKSEPLTDSHAWEPSSRRFVSVFNFVGFLTVEMAMRLVDRIRSRAYALAREGRHADCAAVEEALEREGEADARMALRDPYVRARISALCSKHHRCSRPEMSAYLAPSALPET